MGGFRRNEEKKKGGGISYMSARHGGLGWVREGFS